VTTTESAILKARKYELLDPDVRLMLQVREGNAAAFEALVAKYQNKLVMVLGHLVSDRSLAEDLAQDVFVRIYRARERYVPTAKFSTWLYTITHNVASNALRKASRRKEVNLKSSPSGSMPVRPLDTMAKAKSALMPTRGIDRSEVSIVVREAIQMLGERQRMAMLLSRFEGMSYQEISDTMGLSTQAVKSLLSRARRNLRDILGPYVESGMLPEGLNLASAEKTAGPTETQIDPPLGEEDA
jgi:RNA polymerase sigma-70 factor (ECF subfamily)